MGITFKIKAILLNILALLILSIIVFTMFAPTLTSSQNSNIKSTNRTNAPKAFASVQKLDIKSTKRTNAPKTPASVQKLDIKSTKRTNAPKTPASVQKLDIKSTKGTNAPKTLASVQKLDTKVNVSMSVLKEEILNRAKAMTEVKWTPKHNFIEKKCFYIFIKGKTYQGVPYSMDPYQVSSPNNFLYKINKSEILYGNDCSAYVSAAWGISRQTTLSLYNDIKNRGKIGNKYVCKISWNDLKPTDALLIDNGKGKGHIMLYITTIIPFEPIPVARKDIRSKRKLMKEGYIPIRLIDGKHNM